MCLFKLRGIKLTQCYDKNQINPKILEWAREESGYSVENISSILEIDVERYNQWENTGEE